MANTDNAAKMHLMLFPLFTGAHVAGWRHPDAQPGRVHDIHFHVEIAQTAERGKFDAIFYADAQGFRTIVGKDMHSRNDVTRMDPMMQLSALAMATKHIGLIGTATTSYNEPYAVARRLASLDHISGGRAGWNVVTSTTKNEARNFGRDANFGHVERYERAGEFVDVVRKLWDTWEDDAFLCDKESGRFFDPDKVHGLNHDGQFFKVAGPLTTARSPQGHSVVVQAGASEAGQELSARTADVVFTAHPSLEVAQKFYTGFKAKVAAAGRDPNTVKVVASIQPIVAATEEEARKIADDLNELIHPEVAISMLELALGGVVDLRTLDPNGPLPDDLPVTESSRSTQERVIGMAKAEGLTIMQLARKVAAMRTASRFVGAPEQIADQMEAWFREGGSDGFVISAPYLPGSLTAFVDLVVPILQARGLFRTEYEGATLRENLGLARPENLFRMNPELHHEPEIWQAD